MIAYKKLGLGFDSDVDMGNNEVEEGEAFNYEDDDENDRFDPMVDLSYIDEKLHDVLGHFQKDFEGVVTAENLGAKFGDYGSFLPTYQRAPALSHLRSSAKVDSHNLTTSLSKSRPQEGVHMLKRHEEASNSNVTKRKQEISSAHCADVSSSRFEVEKKYGQSSDEKAVQDCLEVASDNLSTLKMATICNGLGLERSPSSQSPGDIEGDSPNKSPSRIIQIMTSLPLHDNLLLSPLTDYLINLTVKKKVVQREGKWRIQQRVGRASPNVPDTSKSDDNNFRDKKPLSSKKGISSMQLKKLNDAPKDNGLLLKKETDMDTQACEKHFKDIGERIEINVQFNENSQHNDLKTVFSSKTESNISKRRKAKKAGLLKEITTVLEENDSRQPSTNDNSSIGSRQKLKRDQTHHERDNAVPKEDMGNPKTNENSAKAVSMYKDLFGEMELDIELDTEKSCSADRRIDDIVADKSNLVPNSSTKKRFNSKEMVKQSMSEANPKSASNATSNGGEVGPLVKFCQVPLTSEVKKKYGTKETNVHVGEDDEARSNKSSKKKHQAALKDRSLNGISHSPPEKEVQAVFLSKPNVAEEHVHTQIEKERLYEQHPSEGQDLLSGNNGKQTYNQNGSRPSKKFRVDGLHCRDEDEERQGKNLCQVNGSFRLKSGKKSALRDNKENGSCKSETHKGKAKLCESSNESMDCTESYEQQMQSVKSSMIESKLVPGKESVGKGPKENTRSESQTKSAETQVFGVKSDHALCHVEKQNHLLNIDERSFEKQTDKVDRCKDSEKGRSHSLPPSGKGRNESKTQSRHLDEGDRKKDIVNHFSVKASEGDNALEALKQNKALNNNDINLRQSITNGHTARHKDVSSLAKRDSYSHDVSNALREAKDLKHLADRLKNTGSAESTGYYFEAALKFLHGASLLESSSGESAKQSEVIQSMQIYSTTGKLCGFCAHEYEKSKDMATASLAYKCMEVAYMRVIYSSRGRASKDRLELQSASLPGESPLSSASDVDNQNNPKSDKTKGILSSPQVATVNNHVISAGSRPSFTRLLNYAQDANYAMDASRKCKISFAAANQRIEETKYGEEGLASIKRALDFNFHDMEGLLKLVRLAKEAISR